MSMVVSKLIRLAHAGKGRFAPKCEHGINSTFPGKIAGIGTVYALLVGRDKHLFLLP